jgi:hypothetical protein
MNRENYSEHISSEGVEVTIAFKQITWLSDQPTTVKRLGDPPYDPSPYPPLPKGESEGVAEQHYEITTFHKYEESIEIRILGENENYQEERFEGRLFQWEAREEKWVERTLRSVHAGRYTLVVGETDHLSGFGIR